MPPRRRSSSQSATALYVVAALSVLAAICGLASVVRLHPEPTCPVPAAFDRAQGCEPAGGIAQDSDGVFYFVQRCPDGTSLMTPTPIPGRAPDRTPRARPEESL